MKNRRVTPVMDTGVMVKFHSEYPWHVKLRECMHKPKHMIAFETDGTPYWQLPEITTNDIGMIVSVVAVEDKLYDECFVVFSCKGSIMMGWMHRSLLKVL